jgi:hypothetical protein
LIIRQFLGAARVFRRRSSAIHKSKQRRVKMLKYVLLGTAMAVATPVMAQDAGMTAQTPSTAATPSATTGTTATDSTTTASPATTAAPTTAQPAAQGNQVAAIVESEFGTYDKDSNGTLDKTEFAAWMDALKAKAPNASAQPSDPKWNDAAFAQADADKSSTVTKQELAGFLGGAASSGTM